MLYLRNRPVEPGLRPTVGKIMPIFCSLHHGYTHYRATMHSSIAIWCLAFLSSEFAVVFSLDGELIT